MKRLFTIALTVLLANVAIVTKASGNPEIERKAKAQVAKVSQQLLLTKDQEAKLLPIAIDNLTQKESINSSKQSGADKRAAIEELKKATRAKIKAVLTPEQFTKWEAMQEQNSKRAAGSK